MAVEGAFAEGLRRTLDVTADLGDHWGAKGHIRNEMAIHDIHMEPVRAFLDLVGTFCAQIREIRAQDGRCYDGRGRHPVTAGVEAERGRIRAKLASV